MKNGNRAGTTRFPHSSSPFLAAWAAASGWSNSPAQRAKGSAQVSGRENRRSNMAVHLTLSICEGRTDMKTAYTERVRCL